MDHPNETLEIEIAKENYLSSNATLSDRLEDFKSLITPNIATTSFLEPTETTTKTNQKEYKFKTTKYFKTRKTTTKDPQNIILVKRDVERMPFDDENDQIRKEIHKELEKNGAKVRENKKLFAEIWKKVQMNRLNTKVGLMFASKPVVQLIVNHFIGPLTNRLNQN